MRRSNLPHGRWPSINAWLCRSSVREPSLSSASSSAAAANARPRKERWKKPGEAFVSRGEFKRVLQVFVPTLAFVPVTQWLGLYVASFALVAGFMWWIGKIKPWISILTGYLFSMVMFIVFEIAFDVIMPKGPLERLFGY